MEAESLSELVALGRELGINPMLVQGAGGNISIKHGNLLTVKASGIWLRDAAAPHAFVVLDLDRARTLAAGGKEELSAASIGETVGRPSIETAFHALLPERVVIHVHSIHALSFAVQEAGPALLAAKLHDLPWQWIPYVRPGLPLAQQIVQSAPPGTQVYVLQNHGLIVTGATIAKARALLFEVEERLMVPSRLPQASPLPPIPEAPVNWRMPLHAAVHRLALDPIARAILQRGALYPDQVVFLREVATLGIATTSAAPYIVLPERAVFLRSDAGPIVDEMLLGHALLLERLTSADLHYLNRDDVRALTGWEAEHYRQSLSR